MPKAKLSAIVSIILQFPAYAATLWKIRNKLRQAVPFVFNPPQQLIWAYIVRQVEAGKPIRLRILKARQQGVSMFFRLFILFWILNKAAHEAISIANKLLLPQQWVRQSKSLIKQLHRKIQGVPKLTSATKYELAFEDLDWSRYSIGSSEGETPGMGETLNVIHCSEIASWKDPDGILTDLLQAVPPTADTAIIQESTGRAMGDWWYQRYMEAKEPDCEFDCVFIAWCLSPEYDQDIVENRQSDDRYTWADLGTLDKREVATLAHTERYQRAIAHLYKMPDLTPGQMMWRRMKIINTFHGDVDIFANQYPICETEAFLSEGRNVFTQVQVRLARDTQRPILERYDIDFKTYHPKSMTLERNDDGGDLAVYEPLDSRYHYVIGADCQWGVTDRSDFDALYVQCLETDRIVAKVMGRYDLAIWGKIIAGLGWHYNIACVAPERNAKAANSVMPLLRGVSSDWTYPNIYIRRDRLGVKISGAVSFGWFTDEHTKGELMSYAKTQTLGGDLDDEGEIDRASNFDWCDEDCVDQMMAYIWDDQNKMTAPTGAHDDLLMARLITAYVAYHKKPETDLYIEKRKLKTYAAFTPAKDRIRWMIDRDSEEYKGLEDDFMEGDDPLDGFEE